MPRMLLQRWSLPCPAALGLFGVPDQTGEAPELFQLSGMWEMWEKWERNSQEFAGIHRNFTGKLLSGTGMEPWGMDGRNCEIPKVWGRNCGISRIWGWNWVVKSREFWEGIVESQSFGEGIVKSRWFWEGVVKSQRFWGRNYGILRILGKELWNPKDFGEGITESQGFWGRNCWIPRILERNCEIPRILGWNWVVKSRGFWGRNPHNSSCVWPFIPSCGRELMENMEIRGGNALKCVFLQQRKLPVKVPWDLGPHGDAVPRLRHFLGSFPGLPQVDL